VKSLGEDTQPGAIALIEALATAHEDRHVRALAAELLRVLARDHGYDFRTCIAERDRLLREIGLSPDRMSTVLRSYRADVWPRTRLFAENPHPPGSLRWRLWAALAAVDRDLSPRQLRRILRPVDLQMSAGLGQTCAHDQAEICYTRTTEIFCLYR
jgi:hypothetical protein